MTKQIPLLEVKNLRRYFTLSSSKTIKAVDGVSFTVQQGESFGLIGESACGKTTLAKLISRLDTPQGGTVFFQGKDIYRLEKKENHLYQQKVQMIFQNPETSLNPRFTAERVLRDPLEIHGYTAGRIKKRVEELMELVGFEKNKRRAFPHELSGGQRQRLSIARALALEPELLIADEPFSAQDIQRQQQIAALLRKLMKKTNLTLFLIAHDLTLVQEFCRRTAVMYAGQLVEVAPSYELYANPRHPYTRTLLEAAIPVNPGGIKKSTSLYLKGTRTEPFISPSGCSFSPRCPRVATICQRERPALFPINQVHSVACHFPLEN